MKRTIIWGAGQSGAMIQKLLKVDYQVIAYCDNKEALWGSRIDGLPVCAPREILDHDADCVVIAIMNFEAADAVSQQLQAQGFHGEVFSISDLRRRFDLRLAELRLLAEEILEMEIPGDLAELGVYRGDFAAEMSRLFPQKQLHLFDTFYGFDMRDTAPEDGPFAKTGNFSDTSLELVHARLPHPESAVFHPGYFPESVPKDAQKLQFALVSMDVDLFKPTLDGLRWFWPRLSRGGCILIHDYNSKQFPGVGKAVQAFKKEAAVYPIPLCDFHGTCILQKSF